MMSNLVRTEILVSGLVQGVGFRYFVVKNCEALGLKGFTKNLPDGKVYNIVEGEKFLIEDLLKQLQIGPSYSEVKKLDVKWTEFKNEFTNFEVRY